MALFTRNRSKTVPDTEQDLAPVPPAPQVHNIRPNAVVKRDEQVSIITRYDLGLLSEVQEEAIWDEQHREWIVKRFVTCWNGRIKLIEDVYWSQKVIIVKDVDTGRTNTIDMVDLTTNEGRYVDARLVQTVNTYGNVDNFRQRVTDILDRTHP